MHANDDLPVLLEQERTTRLVVRMDGGLLAELQQLADRMGASRNQLAKALLRDSIARLNASSEAA